MKPGEEKISFDSAMYQIKAVQAAARKLNPWLKSSVKKKRKEIEVKFLSRKNAKEKISADEFSNLVLAEMKSLI